jgi:hypothetical protein
MISELLRHGARTPVRRGAIKPSAPFYKEIEEVGYGNLTGNGQHMHMLLGMQLKKEYPQLFDPESSSFHSYQSPLYRTMTKPKINNSQYELHSSHVLRCILSAQS